MTDDFEQVTALIKELLILNRAESSDPLRPQTEKEIEIKHFKRKGSGKDSHVLSLRNRKEGPKEPSDAAVLPSHRLRPTP
jgi:hypothetical protein